MYRYFNSQFLDLMTNYYTIHCFSRPISISIYKLVPFMWSSINSSRSKNDLWYIMYRYFVIWIIFLFILFSSNIKRCEITGFLLVQWPLNMGYYHTCLLDYCDSCMYWKNWILLMYFCSKRYCLFNTFKRLD